MDAVRESAEGRNNTRRQQEEEKKGEGEAQGKPTYPFNPESWVPAAMATS